MAVCYVTKRWDISGSNESERNQLLYEIQRRHYVVRYNVVCSSHLDGPAVIMSSILTPKIGSTYNFGNDVDIYATCVKIDVPVRMGRRTWAITAEYDTNRIMAPVTDDPFLQPPEITCSYSNYDVAYQRDAYGKTYMNSAKRPFDPVPVIDEKPTVWTITRNEASSPQQVALYKAVYGVNIILFTRQKQATYTMRCNEDQWQGRGTYEVRVNSIRATRMLSFGRLYWQVTYEIEERPERKFYVYLLDKSWSDSQDRPFRDTVTGNPLANETMLNGRGERLSLGVSTLASGIGVKDVTATLTGPGFPTNFPLEPPFEIRIGTEVMRVIKITGMVVTVIRGLNQTVAAAHSTAATVTLEPYYIEFRPHKTIELCPLRLPSLPPGGLPEPCGTAELTATRTCGDYGIQVSLPDGQVTNLTYDQYVAYCTEQGVVPLTPEELLAQNCEDSFT